MMDALSGRVRTWPYGTKIHVLIDTVKVGKSKKMRTVICIDEAAKEGYVLIERNDGEPPREKSRRFITFTAGGPTGGYWAIDPIQ